MHLFFPPWSLNHPNYDCWNCFFCSIMVCACRAPEFIMHLFYFFPEGAHKPYEVVRERERERCPNWRLIVSKRGFFFFFLKSKRVDREHFAKTFINILWLDRHFNCLCSCIALINALPQTISFESSREWAIILQSNYKPTAASENVSKLTLLIIKINK